MGNVTPIFKETDRPEGDELERALALLNEADEMQRRLARCLLDSTCSLSERRRLKRIYDKAAKRRTRRLIGWCHVPMNIR